MSPPSSFNHPRSALISALLLLPVAINFLKVSYVAYVVPLEDFGLYTLYLSLSSSLVYVFNSGLYEGHLKYFSTFYLSRRLARIRWLQIHAEIASFWGLFAALLLEAVICMVFHFPETEFLSAMILSAHVQAHSNLVTTHARVENNLVRVGMILTLRSTLSAFLLVGLIAWRRAEIGEAYLMEGLCVTVAHGAYLSSRTRFRLMLRFVKAVAIAQIGFWQCYASSIRNMLFALERFTASFLLSPIEMGVYGRILLVYQVMVVAGGTVSQLFQQKILSYSLSRGVRYIGLIILKYQILAISSAGCFLFCICFLFSIDYFQFSSKFLGSGVKMWGFVIIVLSGVIVGTSLGDSLALGSSKGLAFVGIQILTGFIWCLTLLAVVALTGNWSIGMQALMLFVMTCFLFLGNALFVLLH